jgi:hypothetical protein
LILFDIGPVVSNGSEDVITELWARATVVYTDSVSSERTADVEPIGLRFLPGGESYQLPMQCQARPGFDRIALRLEITFTDARDVRWRLDQNWKPAPGTTQRGHPDGRTGSHCAQRGQPGGDRAAASEPKLT